MSVKESVSTSFSFHHKQRKDRREKRDGEPTGLRRPGPGVHRTACDALDTQGAWKIFSNSEGNKNPTYALSYCLSMNVNKAGHSEYFHKRKLSVATKWERCTEGGAGLEGGGPDPARAHLPPAAQRCRSAGSPAQRPPGRTQYAHLQDKGEGRSVPRSPEGAVAAPGLKRQSPEVARSGVGPRFCHWLTRPAVGPVFLQNEGNTWQGC